VLEGFPGSYKCKVLAESPNKNIWGEGGGASDLDYIYGDTKHPKYSEMSEYHTALPKADRAIYRAMALQIPKGSERTLYRAEGPIYVGPWPE
jgi:hypothetical protein